MVFTSHIFIFYFLPFALFGYYVLLGKSRTTRWRNFFLLCVSYVFYGWSNPWFTLLMLWATFVNYACGHVIAYSPDGSPRRRAALVVSVVVSLSTLGFFKYFGFAQDNLNALLHLFGFDLLPVIRITLPVGISFFIFQSLSYSIDVYRRESAPVRSFVDFACFVALFPQLIAGPIVRYHTVAQQLVERTHATAQFSSGVMLFIMGFAKKILLANSVGQVADAAFAAENLCALDAWFGVTAYAFQIYFDFAAYSDMAVGLGRMFGFEFIRNFDSPYLSDSITDFWRRWHISLSTFLRDYLYIPLGGNRKGERRTYINLTIVMLLGGFWHGANWVFVIWGAYHGLLLAFERWRGKESVYHKLPRPIRVLITFVLVLFSWVLFRSPDIGAAGRYFGAMFGLVNAGSSAALLGGELYSRASLTMMALCAVLAFQPIQAHDLAERVSWGKVILLLGLFCFALMTMFAQAFNPFLYFQF